jgi:uncharacterized protein YqgQ
MVIRESPKSYLLHQVQLDMLVTKSRKNQYLKASVKIVTKKCYQLRVKRKSSSVQTNAGGNGGMSKEKDQVTMNRSNLEMYYFSISPISSMFKEGILSKSEYLKAEAFLAEKYCIKKGNLYRLNDLTNLSK